MLFVLEKLSEKNWGPCVEMHFWVQKPLETDEFTPVLTKVNSYQCPEVELSRGIADCYGLKNVCVYFKMGLYPAVLVKDHLYVTSNDKHLVRFSLTLLFTFPVLF